ncbi:hypothetical protein ACHAQJ_008996 [Trichoderma viride]
MVNSSPEYSITKPGLHHLRKRDKPLRTYGRQTSTPEAQSEPPSKKSRTSAPQQQQQQEKPISPLHSANSVTKPDDAAVAAAEATPKQDASNHSKTEKHEESPKKGSILSYFKPALQIPKIVPPSQSQDSPSEEPIPSQPSPKPKQPSKRKARLLKIKTTTHELSDQSSQETDTHTPQTRRGRHPLKTTTSNTLATATAEAISSKSTSSASSSPSPKRKSTRAKTKSSSPSIQTTLNISTQAPFSECKICDTVWNPLYPDDVKYHIKTHKAVLRAQKKRKMDDL